MRCFVVPAIHRSYLYRCNETRLVPSETVDVAKTFIIPTRIQSKYGYLRVSCHALNRAATPNDVKRCAKVPSRATFRLCRAIAKQWIEDPQSQNNCRTLARMFYSRQRKCIIVMAKSPYIGIYCPGCSTFGTEVVELESYCQSRLFVNSFLFLPFSLSLFFPLLFFFFSYHLNSRFFRSHGPK